MDNEIHVDEFIARKLHNFVCVSAIFDSVRIVSASNQKGKTDDDDDDEGEETNRKIKKSK